MTSRRFGGSASDIAQGAASLADMMLRSGCGPDGGAPVVVLISPPAVATLTDMAQMFEGAEEKSRQFRGHYERFAEQHGCEFFDASEVIVSSDVDGIHLEAGEHRKLGGGRRSPHRRDLGMSGSLKVLLVGGPMYDPLYTRLSEFEESEGLRVETEVAPTHPDLNEQIEAEFTSGGAPTT